MFFVSKDYSWEQYDPMSLLLCRAQRRRRSEEHNIDMVNGMDITDSEDMFDKDEQGSNADKDGQHRDIDMDRQPAEGNHKELVGVSDVKLATYIRMFFKFSF